MSGKQSGSSPHIHKNVMLAAILGFVITLLGCRPATKPPDSSSQSFSSVPDTENSDTEEISSSSSSGVFSSSSSSSVYSSSSASGEFSSGSTSEQSSSASSSSSSSKSTQSSSTAHSSVGTSSSSNQSLPSSSSSSSKPPDVVIPDIAVPTSPGTAVLTANGAVLDYSNASNGYVSVKYSGSASRVKFQYICGGKTYTFDVATNGTAQYFPLSCGSGDYTLYVLEIVVGNSYSPIIQQSVNIQITNNLKPYTYPNSYVSYSKSSACVQKAAELCAGKTGAIDKISAIFTYISSNVSYDYALAATVKSGYIPNPDNTLSSKKGICFDYASLMAAMLRSQGIPTRLVIGYASPAIYHAWNEVYTEETGWITPELLMNNRGYNIADATFYASASDKKQISDYIMNSTNYSAVYYY